MSEETMCQCVYDLANGFGIQIEEWHVRTCTSKAHIFPEAAARTDPSLTSSSPTFYQRPSVGSSPPTSPFATLITRRGSTSSGGCRTTLTSTSINLHTEATSRVRARYVAMLMFRNATVCVDASAVFRDNGAPRVGAKRLVPRAM